MTERPRRETISRRALLQTSAVAGLSALADRRHKRASAAGDLRARFGARQQEPVELTFAATDDDVARIQPLLDEYAAGAGLTIHVEPSPYDELYTKLNVNLTQATGAFDVVSIDDPWMPLFAEGEFLKDLGEMMDDLGITWDDDLVPQFAALGAFPADSGIRAIPWVGNVQVFAWRTDVLSEFQVDVPATWDDVLALATEITRARGGTGLYGIGIRGLAGPPAAASFLPVLRGFGLDLLDAETGEPQLARPRAIRAIDLFLQLAKQSPNGAEQVGHAEMARDLATGRIAMSGDVWPDQLMYATDPERSEVADRIAVGAEPTQSGARTPHVTGCWLLGIPKECRNPEAALDLILWLTAREQQKRLAVERLAPPTRRSVLTDADVLAAMPFMEMILNAATHAMPRARTPHLPSIEQILGRHLADGMFSKVAAEELALSAQEEIRELLVREGALD